MLLKSWLDRLSENPRPRLLLGGTGHLILSADEEASAAAAIEREALPILAAADPATEFMIVTGMAPGADLLFSEVASAWLGRAGRSFRRIALMPVPAEVLWADWLARSGIQDAGLVTAMRERFDRALRTADELIQLWPPDAQDWSDLGARQLQYRRLAAALAQQCEVLVAILKPAHAGQPGGTVEVVAWREQGGAVPNEVSSGPRRHRSGWPHSDRLVRVDPSLPQAATPAGAGGVESVRAALRSGNYLLAYDRVLKAEAQGHQSDQLTYLRLLTLANAGSTHAALRRLGELPAALRERDEDWLALEGRLYKDLALRGGPSAAGHFRRAAASYHTAFVKTGGFFSAINAASMALLGGERAQAQDLARKVLAQLQPLTSDDETQQYYLHATEAEAALLLEDSVRAQSALARADVLLQENLNARGRTRKQLRLVCQALKLDRRIVETLRMPPVIFLPPTRNGGGAIRAADDEEVRVAFVYAGLTHPAELENAETLLRRGGRLHVVLAAPREAMIAHWHTLHGADWSRRLAALVSQAAETSVARGFLSGEDAWSDVYAGEMALGLSRLAARRLGCEWRCVGADGRLQDATTEAVELNQPIRILSTLGAPGSANGVAYQRRLAGIIFADFAGFSRLHDDELPSFWAQFMRAISARLATRRADVLLQHTWGDALHVVADSARSAAEIACEIQDCLEQLRPSLAGALAGLELRLSAHFAPVFEGLDPVENARTYFGTQLSFTARIEPVTPPGMIFVTEAFAAQITLEAPGAFAVEYAGDLSLAKAYGQTRLFNLRRAS